MKTAIILVHGYSFSLEDVVVVKEIQEAHIPFTQDRKAIHRFFTLYLVGGFEMDLNQVVNEDLENAVTPVIDLLYNAIYHRKSRIDTPKGAIDVSTLDTSKIEVHFKKM